MKELNLPELIKEVLAKLEELKYSKGTLNGHRCVYKYLLEYAATIPTDEYTEELGSMFLENSSSFLHKRGEKYVCPLKSRGEMAATAIRKLGEYQRFGAFSRRPIAMQLEDSRFGVIKGFADYMVRHGYEAFVPLSSDLPKLHTHGYVPYVFTHEEIQRFFDVYSEETDYHCAYDERFRVMMRMIFEILYCCGLRMSEATGLTSKDVDLQNGILTVRFAKFEKSRYVPMSSDVIADLTSYMDSYIHEPFLFPGRTGNQLGQNSVYGEFRRVLLAAGIPHHGRGKGPRVHDFRHTFACHCLHRWIKHGIPVSSALPCLSTYLGHNDMAATEKYLHMTAEVYPEVSEKLSLKYGYLIPKEVQS